MAYKIVWTKQAIKGYDKVINYLEENWSEKEIVNFIDETEQFLETLIFQPEYCKKATSIKIYIAARLTDLPY